MPSTGVLAAAVAGLPTPQAQVDGVSGALPVMAGARPAATSALIKPGEP